MVFSETSMSAALKDFCPSVYLLFESLYFTTISVWSVGIFEILTISPPIKPWVDAVDTVTIFLETVPTIELFLVVKLWLSPVPTVLKNSKPVEFVVPTPTKEPSVPKPSLTVEMPIRSFVISAIYKSCVCGRSK